MEMFKETTTVIYELIEVHKEREAAYVRAAELVDNLSAKHIFHQYAEQSAGFARELKPFMDELSFQSCESVVLENLFKGWSEVKDTITSKDTKGVYAWCEIGEDNAMRVFETVIIEGIPQEVESLVSQQYLALKESHCHIKALRDA